MEKSVSTLERGTLTAWDRVSLFLKFHIQSARDGRNKRGNLDRAFFSLKLKMK